MNEVNNMSLPAAAEYYANNGFAIVPLKPKTKGAYESGWAKPDYYCSPLLWNESDHANDNIGVVLQPSKICVLDIDNVEEFRIAIKGIGLTPNDDELPFWESDTAGIKSGKPNRAKLLFLSPADVPLQYHKLQWFNVDGGRHTVFELRCGYVQDVFPPSIHPDTGKPYQWVGSGIIRPMPADLLLLWQHWETFLQPLERIDRFYVEPKPVAKRGRPRNQIRGRDLIREWVNTQNLSSMLINCGYKQVGRRFVSPDSQSGSAGVILSGDGKTFFCFNESDVFADRHQHNAFDLMLHYEYNDDIRPAIEAIKRDLGLLHIADDDLLRTVKALLNEGANND